MQTHKRSHRSNDRFCTVQKQCPIMKIIYHVASSTLDGWGVVTMITMMVSLMIEWGVIDSARYRISCYIMEITDHVVLYKK